MDIYNYIKLDHAHVSHLFNQFKQSELPIRKQQIVDVIAQELTVHLKSEQETFYKALKTHIDSKDDALHGKKEHDEIEHILHQIMHGKKMSKTWLHKVEKMQEVVEHHVHEEEHEIFKKAKQVLSQNDAYILKEKMHYLKQQLLRKMD